MYSAERELEACVLTLSLHDDTSWPYWIHYNIMAGGAEVRNRFAWPGKLSSAGSGEYDSMDVRFA